MATLIRGGHVLTQGPAGDLIDGVVAVEDSRIAAVGSWQELSARYPGAEVVGDGRGIVLPGFVNCHGHFSEGLISGMGETLTLWPWIQQIVRPAASNFTPEMARVGTMLKAVDMVVSGITTVNDMYVTKPGSPGAFITPEVVAGLEEVGIRGQVSYGAQDSWGDYTPEQIMAEHEALAEAAASSQRCTFRMGIATVMLLSERLYRLTVERCRAEGWGVHTHFHEVREEVTAAINIYGATTIAFAERAGLFDVPVLAAHCVWVSDDDIAILARNGVTVSHNPVANMILASGVCPVRKLRRENIAVGLGTDGAASNDNQDMLEVLKTTALLQKVHHLDATAMTAPEVVRMATVEGARALGIDDRVGSLEEGKEADVVLLDGDASTLANVHDPYQSVVFCLAGGEVSDVWVGGQRVVEDRAVTTVDRTALHHSARELSRLLVTKAGMTSELASPKEWPEPIL